MTNNSTTITSERRKELPSRGRNKRTLILESMKEVAFKGLKEDATPAECERKWFTHLIEVAIDLENKDSGLCLRLITERGWASLKPSSELVTFEFDPESTPARQSSQILDAVAAGIIPMDYGTQFIASISSMTNIEVNTELKDRLEKIEASLGVTS